jgi:hypothetical protein
MGSLGRCEESERRAQFRSQAEQPEIMALLPLFGQLMPETNGCSWKNIDAGLPRAGAL